MKVKILKSFMAIIIIGLLLLIGGGLQKTEAFKESKNYIIPKPLKVESGEGCFEITKDTVIYVNGDNEAITNEIVISAEQIREKLKKASGYDIKIEKSDIKTKMSIYLTTLGSTEELGNEGYNLNVTKDGINIIANKPEGIYRGLQSLVQLLPKEILKDDVSQNIKWIIPLIKIEDKPEYSYRGLMIDVARHFFTVDEIKRQIDLAAQYKINKLHLHLSDDQGWRLEVKKYPDLTTIGGSTQVGGGKGGYYTQDEFKDIVKYASERYIEIVPEFDMPGHSNAALASYGFLNPDGQRKPVYTGIKVGFSSFMTDSEKTYEFIDDVFKEVAEISPSKYIHIGGDEADATKKEDYDYFVARVSEIAKKYGKTPIGWDPIDTSPKIDNSTILQNWKDSNKVAVEKKMKIIVSVAQKAYLDMKYNKDTPYGLDWAGFIDVETAYKWDPTDFAPKELVLGIEAPLWTETIESQEQIDYMIYPRLLGYSEIGWTPKEKREWKEYKNRLEKQKERLKLEKVNLYEGN